jgi:transposase
MAHYIGIDVSCKSSVICAVDEEGKETLMRTVNTDVTSIASCINKNHLDPIIVGLETGTECHHLARGLKELGYNTEIIDARKSAPIIDSQKINKNDPNDARGLAQLLRAKMHNQVEVKSVEQLERLALLKTRKTIVETRKQTGNQIRGLAKVQGVKCPGPFNPEKWTKVIKCNNNLSDRFKKNMLKQLEFYKICSKHIEYYDNILMEIVNSDEKVQRLMTAPGVGYILAITFLAYVNELKFSRSRDVGAFVGMTPKEFSSGSRVWRGRISKCGPQELRSLLMQSGMTVLVNLKKECPLKLWAEKVQAKLGTRRTAVAVGRKLTGIMYSMLRDCKDFDFNNNLKAA